MGWTHIATETNKGAVEPLVITVPAGTQNDDLMLAVITHRANGGEPDITCAGWTLVHENRDSVTDSQCALLYRIASSEPANYSFEATISGAMVGCIDVWRGVDTVSPYDTFSALRDTGNSATAPAPSINVANAGSLLVQACAWRHGGDSCSHADGMDERFDDQQGVADFTGLSGCAYTEELVSAGATGTRTINGPASTKWITIMAAFNVSEAGGSTIRGSGPVGGTDAIYGTGAISS